MDKFIMVGCDLHDRNMLLKIAVGLEASAKRSWSNDPSGRVAMIADLKRRAVAIGATRIVFAYEASGLGFTLYDELTAAGIECHVLAPTLIERSVKHQHRKTDERDAERILQLLRSWLLAGGRLPEVWIPDRQTRDDREVVRMRLEVADKLTRCKCQIRCLLKRNNASKPPMKPWTGDYGVWLAHQAKSELPTGAGLALSSLLRQVEHLETERELLGDQVEHLAHAERYTRAAKALVSELKGVGVLTAMVFLTEVGDVKRFVNRQQVGSFLGLTPNSFETGEADDRKGHISRQGPGRIRKVLNQAVWASLRSDPDARAKYDRVASKNPSHKKKAVVALMRDLGIAMWHKALAALAA
jgi:transposase